MRVILVVLAMALIAAPSTLAAEDAGSAFDRINAHYEKIRIILLHDSADGVAAEAEAIGHLVATLRNGFEPAEAGILAARAEDFEHLLPALGTGAAAVAGADGINDVREAFAELSKSMVSYRQMTPDREPVVVFCPMAQKVWLQPAGEIGNPYHGQSMPRCGEVVSE